MAENAVADGAQTVAPATPVADSGQSAGGSVLAELEADTQKAATGAAPDPWSDAEFTKRLESMDFSKAPKSIREKLEAPFERHWTKKFQENAEMARQLQARQDALMNAALERLKEGGVQAPTQTVQDQIRERIEAGDMNALPDLVRQEIEREVGPMRQQAALRGALDRAFQMSPLVREKEPEIAAMLRDDPVLQQMAAANNYAGAHLVLAGLATRIENADLKAKLESMEASIHAREVAYAKRALDEFRARGASLSPESSKAGAGGTAARGEAFSSMQEVLKDAWVKAGGTLDPRL